MKIRKSMQDKTLGILLILPVFIFFSIFLIYPLLSTVVGSFSKFNLFTMNNKEFVGFDNYIKLFKDKIFFLSFRNNIIVAVISIIFQIGTGTIVAALLTRCIRRGNNIFRTIFFAPIVFSSVAVGLIWHLIYDPQSGILNKLLNYLNINTPELGWLGDPNIAIYSVMVVGNWQYTGFMIIILLAGMQGVPEFTYEAARIDGVGEIQAFFYITLPSIINVIVVCFLLTIIGAFKVFDLIYILTLGGPGNATQVLSTYIYKNAFTLENMGYANALAMVLLIISIILGSLQLYVNRKTKY